MLRLVAPQGRGILRLRSAVSVSQVRLGTAYVFCVIRTLYFFRIFTRVLYRSRCRSRLSHRSNVSDVCTNVTMWKYVLLRFPRAKSLSTPSLTGANKPTRGQSPSPSPSPRPAACCPVCTAVIDPGEERKRRGPSVSKVEQERQQILEEMKKRTQLLTDNSWIRQRSSSVYKEPIYVPLKRRAGLFCFYPLPHLHPATCSSSLAGSSLWTTWTPFNSRPLCRTTPGHTLPPLGTAAPVRPLRVTAPGLC